MNLVAEYTVISSAVEERLAQIRRCHSVVDHEGDTVLVGDRRDSLEVENVAFRVADRLGVEGLGVGPVWSCAMLQGCQDRQRS